jgi:hypothetical protein
MKNETNINQKINGKLYTKLFSHCIKQYKDIVIIYKAYIENNQVYGIDYVDSKGLQHIACNTAIANKIITFN